MINNRQASRRNRGRNNGRPNNGNNRSNGENGNRIDNRARGNAPQLLEKYRNLARDAQLAGDRVSTEYYLQFADHYFRVIADNRIRQEEQQARHRRPDEQYEDEGDRGFTSYDDGPLIATEADRHQPRQIGNDTDEGLDSDASEGNSRGEAEAERPRRAPREQREYRAPRQQRDNQPRAEQPREDQARERNERERGERVRRPRRDRDAQGGEADAVANDVPQLDLAVLPPSISRADNDSDAAPAPVAAPVPASEDAPAPAPKRRGRPRKVAAEAAE